MAYFILIYGQKIDDKIYFLLLGWSSALIVVGLVFHRLSKFLLYYMGGITNLYSLFDLSDFFRGGIIYTDAGRIASHYASGPLQEKSMAYIIAILITILSLWVSYKILWRGISKKENKNSKMKGLPLENLDSNSISFERAVKNLLNDEPSRHIV